MTELQKIRIETVRFMRGKYMLNEVGDGNNELKFKQGKKTILTIYIYVEKLIFLIIFGKVEREKFLRIKSEFSQYIQDYYDNSKTYHDGKWMFIDVVNLEVLEEVKRLIQIKKKPNRKPFPNKKAFYSLCGHRCDLCIHYTGDTINEEFRKKLVQHSDNVYGVYDSSMRCSGCNTDGCHCNDKEICDSLKCAFEKGFTACIDCNEYPCLEATAGYKGLEARCISAEDVTWAILPYVPYQYEK
jgi:hypothetical protein